MNIGIYSMRDDEADYVRQMASGTYPQEPSVITISM